MGGGVYTKVSSRLSKSCVYVVDVDGAVDGAVEAVDWALEGEDEGAVDVPGVSVGEREGWA